jgi:hypothetical protein
MAMGRQDRGGKMNERMLQLATLSAANTRLVTENVRLKALITELADALELPLVELAEALSPSKWYKNRAQLLARAREAVGK